MWQGRFDSDDELDLRLWQKVKLVKVEDIEEKSLVFTGYDTDDGVIKNQGRKGAKEGPDAIRAALASLPYIKSFKNIYDSANIGLFKLEEASLELIRRTKIILLKNSLAINLGGGHDIAYATFKGIRAAFREKKIGIINFDAHLDMRDYAKGANSGTMFKQILDEDKNVKYMIIGYQSMANTLRLRKRAKEYGVRIVKAEEEFENMQASLASFMDECELIHASFCMDVFDISQAPGVSAPAAMGLDKKIAAKLLAQILASKKLVALDFAELSPPHDEGKKTAKLISALIYKLLEYKGGENEL